MKNKTFTLLSVCTLIGLMSFFSLYSCKKLDLVRITRIMTDSVSLVENTASVYGTILDISDKGHSDYGFCWSKSATPTINDNKKSFGEASENGFLTFEFAQLELNVNYYVCAYILEDSEPIYGDILNFIITPFGIEVSTGSILVETNTSATARGSVKHVGSVHIEDFGHCWSTSLDPTIGDFITSLGSLDDDTLHFVSTLTNLNPSTTYYVRSYAKVDNSTIIYGENDSINISALMITTDSLNVTGSTTAYSVGTISSLGVVPIQNHGHCWSTNPGPTTNDNHSFLGAVTSTGSFTSNLTSLDTNLTYYIRAYADNGTTVTYGNELTFIITPFSVLSDTVYMTAVNSAEATGDLIIGSYAVSNHGHCWSTSNPPTVSDSKTSLGVTSQSGPYTSNLTNLLSNTVYYVRAYAREGGAVKYGATVILKQNIWEQILPFSGDDRQDAISFSIGTKGYMGTGIGSSIMKDFWEFDQASNAWTQKASYNDYVYGAVGFAIGSYGYIGGGINNNGYLKRDFWQYNPTTNNWVQKLNYAGDSISGAVGFSIGNKGYMGTGFDGLSSLNDFWEYDPSGNTWTQKANFNGSARSDAIGYTIGNKGYVGLGTNGATNFNDFWEYDPAGNTWTQKNNFGGSARVGATSFEINGKGYIGLGWNVVYLNDFWEYDPANDSWIQVADFMGTARWKAAGFSIGNFGYIGTGYDGTINNDDFWKYTPLN